MQNIKLSPHFELREFTESATASKHGIANEPPAEAVENLKALCIHTLEPLREALGLPVIITSGFRSKILNDRITHHSQRSQHMKGCAADFVVGNSSVSVIGHQNLEHKTGASPMKHETSSHRELLIKAFRTILIDPTVDYDQLILYPSFIHVSFVAREKNRHNIMLANGQGKYHRLTRAEALSLN